LARRYPNATAQTLPGIARALEIAPGRTAGIARSGRAVVVFDGVPADRAVATARAALASAAGPASAASAAGAPAATSIRQAPPTPTTRGGTRR
jgi:hypothetical protein